MTMRKDKSYNLDWFDLPVGSYHLCATNTEYIYVKVDEGHYQAVMKTGNNEPVSITPIPIMTHSKNDKRYKLYNPAKFITLPSTL